MKIEFFCFDVNQVFIYSDIREGAVICLIANLMEQLRIDNTVDIYHQARKIAYSCSVFQTEVELKIFFDGLKSFSWFYLG